MIADEITIIEEWVKLDLILRLVDTLDVDALEGAFDDRKDAEGLRDRLRHVLQCVLQALRDTRETARRSSKHWRPLAPALTNAIRDSHRIETMARIANEISALTDYSQAIELWLSSGAKGPRPEAPRMSLHLSRVMIEAKTQVDTKLRQEIASYETESRKGAEQRSRTEAKNKNRGTKRDGKE